MPLAAAGWAPHGDPAAVACSPLPLAAELDRSELFFCSWRNPLLQIPLLENPVSGCQKRFNFLVAFYLDKFCLFPWNFRRRATRISFA